MDSADDAWAGAARGRLIRSSTEADPGIFDLVSVCIPWRDAHVRTGRKDRTVWDEHRECLNTLTDLIRADGSASTIVVGDFNQRAPRTRQPVDVFERLRAALGEIRVVTAGGFDGGTLIDHVAAACDLSATAIEA